MEDSATDPQPQEAPGVSEPHHADRAAHSAEAELFPQDGRAGDESEAGHEVAPQRSAPAGHDVQYFARMPPADADDLADKVASDVRRAASAGREAPQYEELEASQGAAEGNAHASEPASRRASAAAAGSPHGSASAAQTRQHEASPHAPTAHSTALARQPAHGTQVDAEADFPHQRAAHPQAVAQAGAHTDAAEGTAPDDAAAAAVAAPQAVPPQWSRLPQAPHGTAEVTVTLLPMQALTRVTVPVHNPSLYRPASEDGASAAPPHAARDGGDAAPYWVLVAKNLFEALARHLSVHPQSFHIFHQHKRLRFMSTLFLDCDVTSVEATENNRAESVWVSVTFPTEAAEGEAVPESRRLPFPASTVTAAAAAAMDAAAEAQASLDGVPPHLAGLGREEFVARCVRVRRRKVEVAPHTLLEGRRQGYTYDEVIQQMQTLHDTAMRRHGDGVADGYEGGNDGDGAATSEAGENFVTMAVVQDAPAAPSKPFLGGFRDRRRSDRVLLHAATQLYHRDLEYSPFAKARVADRASRQTQTFGISRSCQTHREACVQTPRVDLLLDTAHDFVVVARPYFTAAALHALQDEMAVTIQKLYRQWKARRVRDALEAAESARQHQAGARQHREEALNAAVEDAAQLRRDDPRTAADFERVKQDIIAWRLEEAARVQRTATLGASEKRAALLAITKKELQLLQQLDQRRREVGLSRDEAAFSRNLDRMAAPKQWGTVHVVTPETERAGELRDLYERLVQTSSAGMGGSAGGSGDGSVSASTARAAAAAATSPSASPLVSASPASTRYAGHGASAAGTPTYEKESANTAGAAPQPGLTTATAARLDILLRVKWTVREFNASSALARELGELIDREADLLHRGRKDASLSGLRKRIQALFAQFIEDPAYNPVVKDFVQTARGRARVKAVEMEKSLQQSKSQKRRA